MVLSRFKFCKIREQTVKINVIIKNTVFMKTNILIKYSFDKEDQCSRLTINQQINADFKAANLICLFS